MSVLAGNKFSIAVEKRVRNAIVGDFVGVAASLTDRRGYAYRKEYQLWIWAIQDMEKKDIMGEGRR